MAYKASGKHFREGLSTRQFFQLFPDDKTAEAWFIKRRWPEEVCCPYCGVTNVQTGCKHKTMPFRCREKECGKHFSIKTGTFMQSTKIGYQNWLYAFYLFAHESEECFQHEAPPRAGHHAEVGLAHGTPDSPCLELGPGAEILGSGRGG